MKAAITTAQYLSLSGHALASKQVVLGFDGFVDSIQKVILSQSAEGKAEYFETVQKFGEYITSKGSGGLSLETEVTCTKVGGNVPITGNAIGSLGVSAHCIGAFGYPDMDEIFREMHPKVKLHSFTAPGVTNALEFSDGKIMLAHMTQLNKATWELIRNRIGIENLIQIFQKSDLICLLNWSETLHACEIWEGLLDEVLPFIERPFKVLFDLSDCSKFGNEKILKVLHLIHKFTALSHVTLSLNRNEASMVYRAIVSQATDNVLEAGKRIFDFIKIELLVIHTAGCSYAWGQDRFYQSMSFPIGVPMISTGAGDNFNAGLCIASLIGADTSHALTLANAVAAFYLKNGYSPSFEELTTALETNLIQ